MPNMNLRTREDIVKFIEADDWMMGILRTASELNLPDWWVGAGFPRDRIWDEVCGYEESTPLKDIDVVYYDTLNTSEEIEKELDRRLRDMMQGVKWSVKNQARMHKLHNIQPYKSSEDAISKWPETVTCIGVSLNEGGRVVVTGSDGVISDIVNLTVRKNPKSDYIPKEVYIKRVTSKEWQKKWPKLRIII